VLLGKTHRGRVAASGRGHRSLRDNAPGLRSDDRERVLVAVGINTDHVVQFICKHPD
jgi:hypothetical protein